MIVQIEREHDGRWIAEVPELPGVMTYGESREEAISKVKALALRVSADRLEHGEEVPELREVSAIHDPDDIGPRMLDRIAKRIGLAPEDR